MLPLLANKDEYNGMDINRFTTLCAIYAHDGGHHQRLFCRQLHNKVKKNLKKHDPTSNRVNKIIK